ncbi:MAG: F(420)H(2) dehydrogenase subunit I [Methanomassiliicoccales archaeon PtaU1.Bin124]|nr:MAG: F(420)H(2) dehydrogenase subunit I [Methanomassiliicoccales archaeon PtaU1.Bin124]
MKVTNLFRFYRLGVGKRGVVTTRYPNGPAELPAAAQCAPELTGKCDACGHCAEACPTKAIAVTTSKFTIDLGDCIYCGECARGCPKGSIVMGKNCELSARKREGLEVSYDVRQ